MAATLRLIIRVGERHGLPYTDGLQRVLHSLDADPLVRLEQMIADVMSASPHAHPNYSFAINRFVRSVHPSVLEDFAVQHHATTGRRSRLLHYFSVELPHPAAEEGLNHLRNWPWVEEVWEYPVLSLPQGSSDPNAAQQPSAHHSPAPKGVNAPCAWGFPGGDGDGEHVGIVEAGWQPGHPDLIMTGGATPRVINTVAGTNALELSPQHPNLDELIRHGTFTLGVICEVDNDIGYKGIAYNIKSISMASFVDVGYDPDTEQPQYLENAIVKAADALSAGDVLLVEAELGKIDSQNLQLKNVPIEAFEGFREVIANVVFGKGIVVVEPAGNGDNPLSTFSIAARGSPNDSGAIVVGACIPFDPGNPTAPYPRRATGLGWGSNHGPRVDCFAHGQYVATTRPDGGYNPIFDGTSAAAAIIAGVVVSIQGIARHSKGSPLTPLEVRDDLLRAHGTPSTNPSEPIGLMPDLAKILADPLLQLDIPDLYLRDWPSDVGDTPHAGPLATSPDVIVRQAQTLGAGFDPEAAWGWGSGNDDEVDLSDPVAAGKDHKVFVRLLNRGQGDAKNVKATVYWADSSTILFPDQWTPIGTTVLPLVPTGDKPTVSPPIDWHGNDVPATGHYCFIAEIEDACHPTSPRESIVDWATYKHFIRNENNVTWRNFNVVEYVQSTSATEIDFQFMSFRVPGARGAPRSMRLEVEARLPAGAAVVAEMPLGWLEEIAGHAQRPFEIGKGVARRAVHAQGRTTVVHGVFPAGSIGTLRLHVTMPGSNEKTPGGRGKWRRRAGFDITLLHFDGDDEVGRITRRLVPVTRKPRDGKGRKKKTTGKRKWSLRPKRRA